MTLNYGWAYFERGTGNAFQLATRESPEVSVEITNASDNIMHIVGETHINIPGIDEVKRMVKLKQVLFQSQSDFEDCIHKIMLINLTTTLTFEWAYVSTPAFIKLWSDGSTQYTTMELKYKKSEGLRKVARGSGVVYECKSIVFEQAG